jgi:hypothetical protein
MNKRINKYIDNKSIKNNINIIKNSNKNYKCKNNKYKYNKKII